MWLPVRGGFVYIAGKMGKEHRGAAEEDGVGVGVEKIGEVVGGGCASNGGDGEV